MALAATGAILYLLWTGGAFLPRWIVWNSETLFPQSGAYEIQLRNKMVTVLYEGSPIWSSPERVLVQDILSFDIDNDSADELILLCWKIGR